MAQADVPFKNKTCLTSTAIWNSCIISKCFSTISKISVHRIRYGIKDILSGISVLLMKSVRSCRLRCLSCLRNSATKYTFPTGLWIMSVFFCFPLIAFEWRRHERVVQLHRALCILAESPFMGKIFKGHLGMGTRSVTSCKWCENVCETYELSREIIFSVEGLNFLRWLQRGSEDFIILLGG